MERDYNCIACAAPFKVMNEIPSPATPEAATEVSCPLCKAKNSITWPTGARVVAIAKYPPPKKTGA